MMHPDPRLVSTTPEHRRRRHLAVYRRALATAGPEGRADVSARYRTLFEQGGASESVRPAA